MVTRAGSTGNYRRRLKRLDRARMRATTPTRYRACDLAYLRLRSVR